jgi:hypothetical protein
VTRDACGNQLRLGDYIAYATRGGNTVDLKLARVVGAVDGRLKVVAAERSGLLGWRRQARVVTLRSAANTCRVEGVPSYVQELLQ